MIDGPDNNYNFTGHLAFNIKSNPYSATVTCLGHKLLTFKDGQKIKSGWINDYIWNVFMGTMSH